MQATYNNFWADQETKRMTDSRRLYDWYFNDRDRIMQYIRSSMQKIFPPPSTTLDKMNIRVMNIVRRVIRKISLVNSQGIERRVDGGRKVEIDPTTGTQTVIQTKNDENYQKALLKSTIARKQREWRRMGIFFNTVLVQPVWVYDTNSPNSPSFEPYLDFWIHTPAWTRVMQDELNPLKAKAFRYDIKYTLDGIEQNVSVYWDSKSHYLQDKDGRKFGISGSVEGEPMENKEMLNPYGMLPIAIYRVDESNDFWGEGLWDLVDGNEEVCIQMTNLFYTALFQSHGERVAVNMNLPDPLGTGPDKVFATDGAGKQGQQNSEMYYINANAPIATIQSMIDWLVDGIQKLKGLTPSASQIDPQAISGIAKMMDAVEMAEDRSEQMIIDDEFEYDLFTVTKAVWNHWNKSAQIGDDAEFSMKYTEPRPPQTVDEKIKEREAGLKYGWKSLVDIIMEDNVGMSREDAEKKLQEIILQQRRIKDIYGVNEPM
jgi:hypothetical protein